MTVSDPAFPFQSVTSLVLAECVEVTFSVLKEDLPYVCLAKYMCRLCFIDCGLICCQAHVYLDKHTHNTHAHMSP